MLHAVEVGELDDAASFRARAITNCNRIDVGNDAVQRLPFRLLQEVRHARRRALITQRAQPRDVTRAGAGAGFAAGDQPGNSGMSGYDLRSPILLTVFADTLYIFAISTCASALASYRRRISCTCSVVSFAPGYFRFASCPS